MSTVLFFFPLSNVTKTKRTFGFLYMYFCLKDTRVLSLFLLRRLPDIFSFLFFFLFNWVVLDSCPEIHVTEKLKAMFLVREISSRPYIV